MHAGEHVVSGIMSESNDVPQQHMVARSVTSTTTASSSGGARQNGEASHPSLSPTTLTPPSTVITFAMTIEYNGFNYVGFQRQLATPRGAEVEASQSNTLCSTSVATAPANTRKRKTSHVSTNYAINSKMKKSMQMTVQQALETALQKWTNLSIATLRVRGAGRTDKG